MGTFSGNSGPDSPPSSFDAILGGPFLRVTAANFLFFLCFASFFLLPKHLHEIGADEEQIGDIMAVFGLAATPLTLLVGKLVDRFRRRPIFLAGAALMAASSASFALISHLSPMLYVLRVLQGLAFACCFTSASTLAADLAPVDRRAQALGIFGIFTLITHGLAVSMAELIEKRVGFPALFVIVSGWALLAAFLFRRVPETRHAATPARGSSLLALVKNPHLYPSMVVSLLAGSGFGAALTFVPVLGEARHWQHVSVFFLAYTAAAVTVRIVGGRLADVAGRRRVVLPSLAVFAAALAAIGRVQSEGGLALAGLAFGAGHGLLYPALNALVVDASAAEDRGKAMALYNSAFNAGVTGGNVLFGRIADAYGYANMFALAGLGIAGALAFFWRKSVPGT
jgi:predicted MFS family arabinose efflux permease